MKRQAPQLRELPQQSTFSAPHAQCREGALYFLSLLETQTAWLDIAVDEQGGTEDVMNRLAAESALQRQALSEAVQVFAAMTVESAVNLLGVLSLGEQQYIPQLERRPLLEKFSTLLEVIDGKPPEPGDELVAVATQLGAARNEFVHPKPQEGPLRPVSRARRGDLNSARAAVADMERFLELLRGRNRRYMAFFMPF
jgi:hypothetical protein